MNPATIAQLHAVETYGGVPVPGASQALDLPLGPPPDRGDASDRQHSYNLTSWAFPALRFRCPECSSLHSTEDAATECCPMRIAMVYVDARGERFNTAEELAAVYPMGIVPGLSGAGPSNCPVCGDACESTHEATECCLWKDLDAPVRWSIAAAVESGATWSEALAPFTGNAS